MYFKKLIFHLVISGNKYILKVKLSYSISNIFFTKFSLNKLIFLPPIFLYYTRTQPWMISRKCKMKEVKQPYSYIALWLDLAIIRITDFAKYYPLVFTYILVRKEYERTR